MKIKSFQEYKLLKESAEEENSTKALGSKVSLGDGNDFKPFVVSDDPKSENYGKNKNLAPVVRAFKSGANWGWSKDDSSGQEKPVKITGKKLYLSGGTVRDHLLGKKSRNVELSTSASPDEVYNILKQNGFSYIDKNGDLKSSKISPNQKQGNSQKFWIEKKDKKGRPFVFGIKVNNDEFSLDVFMKTPRGPIEKELESGTQQQDALGRDFTINGMYILLSNDNGPNKDLFDFFGGMHHLSSKKISTIGDMKYKFEEDPSRILRYVRMLNSYGNPDRVSEEDKQLIRDLSKNLSHLDKNIIVDEFKKCMDKDDIEPRKFLKSCDDLGVLNHVFPNKLLDTNFPKEISELGDKHMPVAFMLRMNNPNSLNDVALNPKDLQKIIFLIKSTKLNPNIDDNHLSDLVSNYFSSGIPNRKIRDFTTKIAGIDSDVVDAFLNFTRQPRVKIFLTNDQGEEEINNDFVDLLDPFTGQIDQDSACDRKKQLELKSFQDQIKYMKKN